MVASLPTASLPSHRFPRIASLASLPSSRCARLAFLDSTTTRQVRAAAAQANGVPESPPKPCCRATTRARATARATGLADARDDATTPAPAPTSLHVPTLTPKPTPEPTPSRLRAGCTPCAASTRCFSTPYPRGTLLTPSRVCVRGNSILTSPRACCASCAGVFCHSDGLHLPLCCIVASSPPPRRLLAASPSPPPPPHRRLTASRARRQTLLVLMLSMLSVLSHELHVHGRPVAFTCFLVSFF